MRDDKYRLEIGFVLFALLLFADFCFGQKNASSSCPASCPARVLKLRVVTYNILGGRSIRQVLYNIRSVHPDIVCLEEAPFNHNGVKYLARMLGMSYQFGPYYPKSGSGIGILATGKITPIKIFSMKKERNFGLAGYVDIGGDRVLVIAIHLKSLPRPLFSGMLKSMGPRAQEARQIVDFVKKHSSSLPVLVAGDCNTLPFTPEYITLSSELTDCCVVTHTSNQPSIFIGKAGYRIDHIFVKGNWSIKKVQVCPFGGSDHRMVWADLELRINGQKKRGGSCKSQGHK